MITEIILHAHHAVLLAAAPSPAPSLTIPSVPGIVPNPAPTGIPGLDTPGGPIDTIIGWGKSLAIAFGVMGLMACGVMMIVGRRNRHSLAADGAAGIPWVIGGLLLVSLSSTFVGVFI